ncbi:hypothetical protein D3C79_775280 [compost metagenome]
MFTREIPHCCTGYLLADFRVDASRQFEEKTLIDWVVSKCKFAKKDGFAVAMATLTTQQEKARKVLMDLWFISSERMSKKRHADRDLYLLYLPLDKFVPPAIAGRIPQPRDAQGRFIKKNPFA